MCVCVGCICAVQEVDTCTIYALQYKNSEHYPESLANTCVTVSTKINILTFSKVGNPRLTPRAG